MEYEIKKFIDKLIVNFVIISFNKNIIKPIDIETNKTLKNFHFFEIYL